MGTLSPETPNPAHEIVIDIRSNNFSIWNLLYLGVVIHVYCWAFRSDSLKWMAADVNSLLTDSVEDHENVDNIKHLMRDPEPSEQMSSGVLLSEYIHHNDDKGQKHSGKSWNQIKTSCCQVLYLNTCLLVSNPWCLLNKCWDKYTAASTLNWDQSAFAQVV